MRDVPTLVVRNIGSLVTCEARDGDPLGAVSDAVLVAVGGHIVYAGSAAEATFPPLAADVVDIDARGAAVIPGFVDAHTHAAWLGDRAEEYAARAEGVTYEEIARRGGGIRSTVRATAAGSVDQIAAAAGARLQRMQEHGTTSVR
jgi:imidazolonepropionase